MYLPEDLLDQNRDYLLFALVMGALLYGLIRYISKNWSSVRAGHRMRVAVWSIQGMAMLVLTAGWFVVQLAEEREFERTKNILTAGSPVLAYELSQQGHASIQLGTAEDDSEYLKLIHTMVDWIRLSPNMQSLYTMRKLDDGRNVFILGPETDYNRDGIIEGELESRVPIGFVYEEAIPELEEAFTGTLAFDSGVMEDQWGLTISAYIPLYDSNGLQEAVLGIDFDGEQFVENVAQARLRMIGLIFFLLAGLYAIFLAGVYYVVERQHRRHQEDLRYLAYHDMLTGLPNRASLNEWLAQQLAEWTWKTRTLAVLVITIDRFRSINNSFGHQVGEQLLQHTAERLSACVRKGHFLARYGDSEFCMVLQLSDMEDVREKARELCALLERPLMIDAYELYVTQTIGACLLTEGCTDAVALIRNADTALNSARAEGWSFNLYTEDMKTRLNERLSLEHDMRRGFTANEFLLHYQPKVDVKSGKTVGMEALIRWKHPQRGFVSPGQFIPIAEDSGFIIPIGEWVFAEVCRQLKAWECKGLRLLPVSVNLSSIQFQKKGLVAWMVKTMSQYQISPSLLELELTESGFMQSPELSNITMHKIKQHGLSIALDDFGTGYSSLSYLRSFPLDVLKVDRSFIKYLTSSKDNEAIVDAIIRLGKNLGLKVVCEGVETKEQVDCLTRLGCDEIQGFYYGRPMPAEQLEQWLDARDDAPALIYHHIG